MKKTNIFILCLMLLCFTDYAQNFILQPFYVDGKIRVYNKYNAVAASPAYTIDLTSDAQTYLGVTNGVGINSVLVKDTFVFVSYNDISGNGYGGVLVYHYSQLYPNKTTESPYAVVKPNKTYINGQYYGLSSIGLAISPTTGDLYVATNYLSSSFSDAGIYYYTKSSKFSTEKHFASLNYDVPLVSPVANLAFDGYENLWATEETNDNGGGAAENYLVCFKSTFQSVLIGASSHNNDYYLINNPSTPTYSFNSLSTRTYSQVYLLSEPEGIAFDANGNLWLANNNDATGVGNCNPDGSIVEISSSSLYALTSSPNTGITQTIATTDVNVYVIPGGKPGGLLFDGDTLYVDDQGQNQGSSYIRNGTVWKWNIKTTFNTTNFVASGAHTGYPGNGSLSINNKIATFVPTTRSTTLATICSGNTILFNGKPFSNTGTYSDTLYNSNGGDSIATLVLTIDNTKFTPSVGISANFTSISPNKLVTFTAYPFYGGSAPTYNWYKNNIIQIAQTGNTYTDNYLNNKDSIKCILFNNTDNTGCLTKDTAGSSEIVMSVKQQPLHIYNFSPHIGSAFTKIHITGAGFRSSPITHVFIGGEPAYSFNVVDDGNIDAVALPATNGTVVVQDANYIDTAQGFLYASPTVGNYQIGIIQDYGGTGVAGYTGDGGAAIDATYNHPSSVRMDYSGKRLFIADTDNKVIREIYQESILGDSLVSSHKHKTIFSKAPPQSGTPSKPPPGTGSGGGATVGKGQGGQGSLVADSMLIPNGCSLFATSTDLNCVFVTNPSHTFYIMAGSKTGVAGYSGDNGIDSLALFNHPAGIVSSRDSSVLYIADEYNNCIRRIDLDTHIITTFAGNGTAGFSGDGGLATNALLNRPHGLDIDSAGNLYIADSYNNRIRKVDTHGFIYTIAGNGLTGYTDATANALATSLNQPMGVSIAPNGYLFIADTYNNRVRTLAQNGNIYTLTGLDNDTTAGYYGEGVPSNLGKFNLPTGVAWDTTGGVFVVYVSDANNNRIRAVTFGGIPNNIWTGSLSNDWQSPGNWSNGQLPTTTGTVTIPLGQPNKPKLTASTIVDTLILEENLDLNGQHLALNGPVYGLGRFATSNTSASLSVGGDAGTLYFDSVNNNLGSLTINGNASLGNSLNIYGLFAPNSGNFNTGDNLTLKSVSIANSAVVGKVGGTLSGNVTVERFIPQGQREFRDLGPEVANAGSIFNNWQEKGNHTGPFGMMITGSKGSTAGNDPNNGFDYTPTGNHSMFSYVDGVWDSVHNTLNTLLDPFQAFRALVRGNRTINLFQYPQPTAMLTPTILRTTGQLVTGTVTYTTSGISSPDYISPYHLTSGDSAYTFLANPYVCAIDWKQVWQQSTNISPSFYYADPTFLTNGYQTYVTYNALMGTSSNPLGSKLNQYIQPAQGFIVQNTTGVPRMVISENNKMTDSSHTGIFSANIPINRIAIGLNRGGVNVDGAVSAFSPNASASIGNDDSYKLPNPADNVSFFHNGCDLSILGLPLPISGESLQVHLLSLRANTAYTLRIDVSNLIPNGTQPYLVDKLGKTSIKLIGDSNVAAFVTTNDTSSYATRFSIVFRSTVLPIGNIRLSTKLQNQAVNISWTALNLINVSGFEVERNVNNNGFAPITTVSSQNFNYVDANPTIGTNTYRIKAIFQDGSILYSPESYVNIGSSSKVITIYPNPIKGKRFMLHLENLSNGAYSLDIFNPIGIKVSTKQINHKGGDADYPVLLPTLAAGNYTLSLTGADKQSVQTSFVIP